MRAESVKYVLLEISDIMIRQNSDGKDEWIGSPGQWTAFMEGIRFYYYCVGFKTVFGLCTSRKEFNADSSTWKLILDVEKGLGKYIDENTIFITDNQEQKLEQGLLKCANKNGVNWGDVMFIDSSHNQFRYDSQFKKTTCVDTVQTKEYFFGLYALSPLNRNEKEFFFPVFEVSKPTTNTLNLMYEFILIKIILAEKITGVACETMLFELFKHEQSVGRLCVVRLVTMLLLSRNSDEVLLLYFKSQYPLEHILQHAYNRIKKDYSKEKSKAVIDAGILSSCSLKEEGFFTFLVKLEYESINNFHETAPLYILKNCLVFPRIFSKNLDVDALFTNLIINEKLERIRLLLTYGIKPKSLVRFLVKCSGKKEIFELLVKNIESEVFASRAELAISQKSEQQLQQMINLSHQNIYKLEEKSQKDKAKLLNKFFLQQNIIEEQNKLIAMLEKKLEDKKVEPGDGSNPSFFNPSKN